MKIVAQVLLIIFFVILFFAGLASATFKFQLLDYDFWQNTFQKHNVYQNLAIVSKNSFESQIAKEGGNKNDIGVLTDLITQENAKDVTNRNLWNFLSFANGDASQINVYLPIDKVPADLLPKNIAGAKSEMPIADLFTKFNFQDWQNLPLQNLSHAGKWTLYFFVGTAILFLLVIILLFLLVERGAKFVGLGIAFVISGCLTFFLTSVITNLKITLSKDLISNPSIMAVIAGTIFPSVVTEIISVWQVLSLILFTIGLVLFLIKKPR